MIISIPSANRPADARNRAGLEAERTMAFYLRRAFGDEKDVFVYNDLRLVRNGDVAQIDHLVLHRFGMVIVESKSVSGEVVVNSHGEWSRRSGRHMSGIPSPVLQAKRQERLLRLLLRDHQERILNRLLFGTLQVKFNKWWPIEILVAVADQGRISRGMEVPELLKADQVPDAIRAIIRRHEGWSRSLNPLNSDGDRKLAKDELGRLVEFLRLSHAPRAEESAPRSSAPRAQTAAAPIVAGAEVSRAPAEAHSEASGGHDGASFGISPAPRAPEVLLAQHAETPPPCRKCGSSDVRMVYARTSRPYYLRCQACDGATPVSWTCAACGKPARIRKRGPDFFRVCEEGCRQVVHVFRNPE